MIIKNNEINKAPPPPPTIGFVLADTVSVLANSGRQAALQPRLVLLSIGITIFNLDV